MKKLLLFLALLIYAGSLYGQSDPTVQIGFNGPFVLYTDNGLRVLSSDREGNTIDNWLPYEKTQTVLNVVSSDSSHFFKVRLHNFIATGDNLESYPKTLVVSDLHGRMDAFVALLRNNSVIDKDYNWSFGENHLIINGDILDRGPDDPAIFWLVYKLSEEAAQAGGRVDFIIGNHEDMVLKGDLRYINKRHAAFSEKTGIVWDKLWGEHTELGRWIRKSKLILKVGNDIYVHAGLSPELTETNLSVSVINLMGKEYLGWATKQRNVANPIAGTIYGSSGIIWYRGLVFDQEKYPGISVEELDKVLIYFGADRIIVGHSEVDEVESRYGGKVIAVNVPHYENYEQNRSGGLLIENGEYFKVDYNGNKTPLFE